MNLWVGPSSGFFIIEVDGQKVELSAFDRFCSFYRIRQFFVSANEYGVHNVEVYLSEEMEIVKKRKLLKTKGMKKYLDKNNHLFKRNELILSHVLID